MDLIEKATILHYHRHRMHQFQPGGVEALGWRGEESQRKRFEVLLPLGNFSGSTILDAGCGYGDLKAFLDQHCLGFTYIGIDHVSEFIAEAKARYGGREYTYFRQADFTLAQLPQVDYVIASGAFCYRCADRGHYLKMVRKLFEAARISLAFNMLDGAVFPRHDLLTGHDRNEVTEFCRTLTPHVELISGYLDDDFTVFLRRDVPHNPRYDGHFERGGDME